MRQLAEYLPIGIFFIVFFATGKDMFWATASLMLSYSIGMLYLYKLDGKLSSMHKGTLAFILILGALTIILKNELFFKWKPTIANWAFAMAFLATHKFAKQPLIKSLFGKAIKMTDKNWFKLSLMWVVFFILIGFLNIYVVYNYSTDFWVKFKVFGLLGATFIFTILQSIWLMKNGEFIEESSEHNESNSIDAAKLSREERIKKLLSKALPDASIELENESHLHAGHAGAEDGRGHFRLKIISTDFVGKRALQRHQLIYKVLNEMMQTDIHALSIDAKTPDEVF